MPIWGRVVPAGLLFLGCESGVCKIVRIRKQNHGATRSPQPAEGREDGVTA